MQSELRGRPQMGGGVLEERKRIVSTFNAVQGHAETVSVASESTSKAWALKSLPKARY